MEEKKKFYKPNPIAKTSLKRKRHIIWGIALAIVAVIGIILTFVIIEIGLKNVITEEETRTTLDYTITIGFVMIGVVGLLFLSGKFDKTIKADDKLKDLISYYYGIDSVYNPLEGVNLDEVNSLGFKDVEFVGFYDYFKATTKNKVRFESSYVYEKDLNREEYKTQKLIEIRKFDVPTQNQEKAIDINEEGKIVYNGNAEKSASCNGTFIIYRDIENAPDFELYIKDKDVVKMNIDDNNYQKVLFSDSRSKFTSRYEIYSTEPEKAEEYLSSKLLSRFVKLEKYFKKGITFFFKDGDLFVFLNKYRMNLVKIQEDRTLDKSVKETLVKESLDAMGLISFILELKGHYHSPYDDIYKSKNDTDFSKQVDDLEKDEFAETEPEKDTIIDMDEMTSDASNEESK